MVSISKNEALYLASKGAKYKEIIHRTIGVGHKYYMTEDKYWVKQLNNYRESRVVK